MPRSIITRQILVCLLGLILLVMGIYNLQFHIRFSYQTKPDLLQDYTAAQNLLQGNSIYASWNDHPPFNVVMILPLAFLSFQKAFTLWGLFAIAGFYASIWIVMAELKISLRFDYKFLIAGLALSWYPLQAQVALGQLSIVISLCLISSWVLLRRGKEGRAGLLIGLACLIKLFPSLILALMLFQKRWRAFLFALCTLFAGLFVTFLLVEPADILKYVTKIAPADARLYATYPLNLSLFGVWNRLFTDNGWYFPIIKASGLTSMLVWGFVVLILSLLYRQIRTAGKTVNSFDQSYILAILAMILVSPISWQHMLLILVLPFSWLASQIPRLSQKHQAFGVLAFFLSSLPDVQIARWISQFAYPNPAPWYMGLPLLAGTLSIFILWYLVSISKPRYEA